jgi:hypothetical protein
MININDSIERINQDGFVDLTGLINKNTIDKISDCVSRPFSVTHVNGRRGYIKMGDQHFLANTLTWGKEIIETYTNPHLIELCEKYSESEVHLSNYRIYKTLPSKDFSMCWHVDNKIDKYNYDTNVFDVNVISADRGLIIIMYLVDVEEGGVQLVKGSHKWSRKHLEKESFDDMETSFKENIVTFNNRPRGTLIAYDYATIHRATPYYKGKSRMSLFGQYSPNWMPNGEPIILDARDIANLSTQQKRILNFGKTSSTENWPIAKPVETLDSKEINDLVQKQPIEKLAKELFKRIWVKR